MPRHRHRDQSEHSLLLLPDHKFGHHAGVRPLAPEVILGHHAQPWLLVWTGSRQCPLYSLSYKMLKNQLQIWRQFFESKYVFHIVYEHFTSRHWHVRTKSILASGYGHQVWTGLNGAMSHYFRIFSKVKLVSLNHLNSKNNGLVLLLKTIFWHWNCFLSSVSADGKDRNGLKLEKIGPIFSSFDATSAKITKIIVIVSSP